MKKYWVLLFAVTLIVSCKLNTTKQFIKDISCYSDFSTVNWSELSDKYYHPNTADWDSSVNNRITNEFPGEIATEIWRTDFHQKSQPLRAKASKDVTNSLNRTEAMFDTVFVRCVSQEYYLRLFPEMYNETMKPAINELIENINIHDNQL